VALLLGSAREVLAIFAQLHKTLSAAYPYLDRRQLFAPFALPYDHCPTTPACVLSVDVAELDHTDRHHHIDLFSKLLAAYVNSVPCAIGHSKPRRNMTCRNGRNSMWPSWI
jgi:hypothetical protein